MLFEIAAAEDLLGQLIPKGSVAVDGISLTIVGVDRERGSFSFAAIPHTLSWTNLGERAPGDKVNVEIDAFAKYVLHALEGAYPAAARRLEAESSRRSSDERLRSLLEGWGADL